MSSMVKPAPVYIPTGFEEEQRRAERRQKIADMLIQSGMQNASSSGTLAQALGSLAQMVAGKISMGKADKLTEGYQKHLGEAYNNKWTAFNEDRQNLSPQEMVAKYGNDPMLAEAVKPYQEAMTTGLKEGQEHTFVGDQWMRKGNIQEGSFKPNDPNNKVVRGPNGEWMINPVAITAAVAAQGIPEGEMSNPTVAMNDPAKGLPPILGAPQSRGNVTLTQRGGENELSFEQWGAARDALKPGPAAAWLTRNPNFIISVTSPEQAKTLPSGTRIRLPDGTEGKVP